MEKIGIVIDSSFGLTEEEAHKRGMYFVPIIITVDGNEKRSGIDIDLNWLYDNLKPDSEFKTSACLRIDLVNEWRRALEKHDHLLHIPISKHISSTYSSACVLAENEEFKGKVTVYESSFIGPWFLNLVPKISEMIENGATLNQYLDLLNLTNKDWIIKNY